jgi:hypothetical protein
MARKLKLTDAEKARRKYQPVTNFGDRTRWLGDAYQAHHKDDTKGPVKLLALVQTPGFVGDFLLDGTLEAALAPLGATEIQGRSRDKPFTGFEGGGVPLEEFRAIDPTCGTGHLLCQMFDRLWPKWEAAHPELSPLERSHRVLASITGVDLDPLCVEIARLRLIVAACDAAGVLPYGAWGHRPRVAWADALLPADHPMQPMHHRHSALVANYGNYTTKAMLHTGGVEAYLAQHKEV